MSKKAAFLCGACLCFALSTPAIAASRKSDPVADARARVIRVIQQIKHFFVPTANDEVNPPKP